MLNQLASLARLDFSPRHRQPSAVRVVLASIASIAGSLAADAILVIIGEAVFPSTRGFAHFQFSDYAKLTVVGVIIACVSWPIVTRISSAPRWLFFRLAILVTLVLWLPDLYILYKGESAKAVAVLMVMHLAIAVVTYNLLVHIAPVRPASPGSADGRPLVSGSSDGRPLVSGSSDGRPLVSGSSARESEAGQRGTPLSAEQPPRGHHRHAR